MNYYDIQEKARLLLTQKRFDHSVNVAEMAVKLAEQYGADTAKAKFAGMLHDCAKGIGKEEAIEIFKKFGLVIDDITLNNEKLLHGPVGACMAQYEMGIVDAEILDAIWFHTTGKSNMNLLTKIIYIADLIEPSREFEGVSELRKLAFEDIDSAIIAALGQIAQKNIRLGTLIHPDSVHARNYLILTRSESYQNQESD